MLCQARIRNAHLVLIASLTSFALAGPLTPPSGSPASTYKTLHEVNPSRPIDSLAVNPANGAFIIRDPGAFHLTNHINLSPADTAAIEVRASDVLIDFRGFRVRGTGANADAVLVLSGNHRVTLRDGVVSNLGNGEVLDAGIADGCVVEDMRIEAVSTNGGVAVFARDGLRVQRCTFNNAGRVWANDGLLLTDVSFIESREAILAGDASVITDVTLTGRGGSTINNELIQVDDAAVIQRVSMTGAFHPAIEAGDNASISDCVFHNDDQSTTFAATVVTGVASSVTNVHMRNWGGIGTNNGSIVSHCSVWGAPGVGISVVYGRVDSCRLATVGGTNISASASVVTDTRIDSINASLGILAGFESILINNRIVGPSVGIDMTNGSIAEGNILNTNATAGIIMRNTSRATNNTFRTAGLTVSGTDNLITGNVFVGPSPQNLSVTGTGNLIYSNHCFGSVFSFAPGNSFGAILGGGGVINATNPYHNFQY